MYYIYNNGCTNVQYFPVGVTYGKAVTDNSEVYNRAYIAFGISQRITTVK